MTDTTQGTGRGAPLAAPGGAARPAAPWAGAVVASLVVLALVVRFGGAFSAEAVPGLTRSGALTKGGLAIAELAAHLCSAVAAGWLLLAAVFLPGDAPAALVRRHLRAAALWAAAWAVAALAVVMFSAADLFGVPVTTGVTGNMLRTFLLELPQGRALLLVALAAVAVAVLAQLTSTPSGAAGLLLVALAGVLPPVFTGHATAMAYHAWAVYSLVAHVLAAALWVGGLVVLVAVGRDPDRAGAGSFPAVVGRYSALAGACFAVVTVSGLVNAWVRLGGFDVGSRYGALVVAKAAALVALGGFGWWHRRVSVPGLRPVPGTEASPDRRGRHVFVRIAAVEVVVMAATMALATGLSRTPPPEVPQGTLDLVALKLGFPLPGPASWEAFLLNWRPDPLLLPLVLLGAVLYGAGVRRLRRAGRSWPVPRVVAWYGGLAVMLVATSGGLARYSMVLFSAHVVQHLLLSALVPMLLLAGAPVTLALRALPRRPGAGGRTARELLVAALRSRAMAAACHPVVAPLVFVASLHGFYFSPLLETSLRDHAVHSAAMAVFVMAGLAYLWPVTGVDPLPRRPPPWARFPLAAVVVPFHTVFGVLVVGSGEVLAAAWFTRLGRTWGSSPLADQRLGGGLLWALGVIAALAVIAAPARRWLRDGPPAHRAVPRAAAAQLTEE
ncbi:cytochrome c oxidase assembly protein [Actinomadura sp. SCN-SB]|uniref:cytochrome c oxidase assembly protein n=1 Tax=Actinomadura sp. SCN-SB TaxID=3373092 RepID=UPI00375036CD